MSQNSNSHIANFFELPVSDIARAKSFYGALLGVPMIDMNFYGSKMAFMRGGNPSDVSGALVYGEGYTPSETGALVYLNGGPDLNTPLNKVAALGGKVIVPKTKISDEAGYFAVFRDTKGNRVALHSRN